MEERGRGIEWERLGKWGNAVIMRTTISRYHNNLLERRGRENYKKKIRKSRGSRERARHQMAPAQPTANEASTIKFCRWEIKDW